MYPEKNRIFRLFDGEPIRLRWGGWVSDTYILQREGWKFHTEEHEDLYRDAHVIHLAATSPDNYMVISGRHYVRREEIMNYSYSGISRMIGERGIEMQQYNSKDVFRYTDADTVKSWMALSPTDMTMPTEASERQIYMRDFKVFAPSSDGAKNEIFIPEENVDELLNKILKLQYPEQQEMKKGLIMPERKPIIQAKIFSLAV